MDHHSHLCALDCWIFLTGNFCLYREPCSVPVDPADNIERQAGFRLGLHRLWVGYFRGLVS